MTSSLKGYRLTKDLELHSSRELLLYNPLKKGISIDASQQNDGGDV